MATLDLSEPMSYVSYVAYDDHCTLVLVSAQQQSSQSGKCK